MKPLVCELERKPIGAAPQGSKITISARADRALISRVEIIMRYDNDGCEAYVPMAWCDLHCGLDCYEVSIDTSDYRGLIWYYLRAHTYDGGTIIYGEHGTEEPRQITIYERKLETPNWYQNGVTYHVFVDRFYRASASPKLLDDPDFIVHHDMADKPNYLPDEHGEILNNDIYGGNLAGIIEKLPYLKTLGVTNIYLSP
ncbi:MAG: alpha-amylase family glycosyl hydrolase, partial [Clostridia bacterium]